LAEPACDLIQLVGSKTMLKEVDRTIPISILELMNPVKEPLVRLL
jgi:hypothetical protein